MTRYLLTMLVGASVALGASQAWAYEDANQPSQAEVNHPLNPDEHNPGQAEAPKHHKKNLTEAIFSHVSNENELEFGSPVSQGEATIELPRWEHAFGVPWLDLSITKHLVWFWVACLLTILIFGLLRPKTITPRGFAVALEMLVLFIRDEVARPTIGEPEYRRYTPYLLSAFFVILVANLLGVVPYTSTATGNVMVTAALAVCTFFITQYASIKAAGIGGYFAHLTGGVHWLLWPIMVPVEILGLFTKPFALCLRLFANMVAGHIVIFYLLGLIFILKTIFIAPVSVALAVCIYLLEIFVAFLQAYVFTILSSVFIGMGVAMGHHGHENHGHAEHDPKLAP